MSDIQISDGTPSNIPQKDAPGASKTPQGALVLGAVVDGNYAAVGEETLRVVGKKPDGFVVVESRGGGWRDLPGVTPCEKAVIPGNPAAKILARKEYDFDLLENQELGLKRAPADLPSIPDGDMPLGTICVKVGHGSFGNPADSYAFTPDGLVYRDGGRGMTHGGTSPWRLEYVAKWFQPAKADETLPGKVMPQRVAGGAQRQIS